MAEIDLGELFEIARDQCEYSGHFWSDMGGGMQICTLCMTERETPDGEARDS